ncbi:hypothetical protein [Janthinobacterium sp. MDT1-19]|uniref:hypothetical protein n=1 Tax=Janthinobacterium sp. MDT1-19 TaxID=1259339 RepID=UPI003F28C6C6
MRDNLCSIRAIAQRLYRLASTMGREIAEGRSWTCRAFIFALPRSRTASSPANGRAT